MKFKISEYSSNQNIVPVFMHDSCTDYISIVSHTSIHFIESMPLRSFSLGLALKFTNPKAVTFSPDYQFIKDNSFEVSMNITPNKLDKRYSDIIINIKCINGNGVIERATVLGELHTIDGHLEYGE